jgi:tripartite-type tricarboxylate transporter receptor subunit TctC
MLARALLTTAALLMAITAAAHAQTYPAKAIRLVIPFPPGGSTDLTGRVLGAKLGETFGQQVIVANRPQAGVTMDTPGSRA